MATSTTSLLVSKQEHEENPGTWGDVVNAGLDVLDQAIAGFTNVTTTGGSTTLADVANTADAAKSMVLDIDGVLVSNATIIVPKRYKVYAVRNATSGSYTVTINTATGTGAVIPQGASCFIIVDPDLDDIDFLTPPSVGGTGVLPIAEGGTSATTASGARTALGLQIGLNVQAWDADLDSWAAITRASGFDTFVATPSLANLGALLTDDASGLITFMTTPSSVNLKALVTDETGSGALVFANTPTLVTPLLGTPTSGVLTNCTGLVSIIAANEAADTTCFPAFFTAATGELGPKTNASLTFNSSTGALGATSFVGALTGNADTVTWANEATDTTCFIGFATASSGSLAPKTNANMTFNSNTGVVTFASAVLTTATISGGTINNSIIGGSTPAAVTGTTMTGNAFVPNSSSVPTNGLYLPAANTLGWAVNSAAEMQLTSTALSPAVDGGNSLGTTALGWQNLFGNTGFVLNIEASDWVATHTTGILTIGTGTLKITTPTNTSTSVVTIDGTQTLTNKTITTPTMTVVDGNFSILGSSDATKILKFEVDGFTTGTTRTITVPDVTDTMVTLAATQELTAKTLTTAVGKGTWTASGTWTLPAITLGGTVSGGGNQLNNIIIGTSTPLAGSFTTVAASTSVTVTSASAVALTVGLAGATNPAFTVDASTGSQAAGFKITGAVTGGTVALVATDSGSNTNLTINAKGSGTIGIGSVSTGAVTITPALTLSAALTYGGVTLTNAVTGTGKMVLDTSPTLVTPLLGTPTSGVLTNCTGLPTIIAANEAADTTCFIAFFTAATGELGPKTNANLPFNSSTGVLTLTAPILGTPTSGTLTNCTGLPISTGVSGLGSNVATMLATFSSANIATACTDETGTAGSLVFSTGPTISGLICTGTTDIQQAYKLTGSISPSQITSNQDDYNPTSLSTSTVLRLTSDATRNITGLQGGAAGRVIVIHNVGSFSIVLKDEAAGSSAANRFALTADITLAPDAVSMLQYDGTSSRWRAVGGAGTGGGTFSFSGSAPSSPAAGDEWVDSSSGILYKYIADADTSQWVEIFGGSATPMNYVPLTGGTMSGKLTISVSGLALDVTNSASTTSDQVAKWSNAHATGAALDNSYHSFFMNNASGTAKEFARTYVVVDTATAASEDGRVSWHLMKAGTLTAIMSLSNAALRPNTDGAVDLGTTTLMWGNVYISSGKKIDFNNGDVVLTHASNSLTLTGAANGFGINSPTNAGGSADILVLKPADYGTNKCGMFFSETASANTLQIQMYDGTSSSGALQFKGSGFQVVPTANATAGTANTYGLQLYDTSGTTETLALGYDSTNTRQNIQSFNSRLLHLNPVANHIALGIPHATGDTASFVFLGSSAGAPTGVPASIPTNMVALTYDRSNNKFYVYNGAWKSVTLT